MTIVNAKLKVKNKHYEISVDFEEALKIQKGMGDITRALNSNAIFYNAKEGNIASQKDLIESFNTTNLYEIAKIIITRGELQKPQEFRDAEKENKIRQIVSLIVKNAVDQHGRPYTEDRIRKAITEVHFNFDNRPVEKQMIEVIEKIKTVIPIKIETKKIKLKIPARFSGSVYGLLKDYKENEEWLSNGDLEVIIRLPAGMQLDFYDKLNSATHGAVVSEEIRE